MHEWHTDTSSNILKLMNQFIGFEHAIDEGYTTVNSVKILDKTFSSEEEAINYVTRYSYGGETAYLVTVNSNSKKLSKAYQNAYNSFIERKKDYDDFNKNLTIGYGRKSLKVTCPYCQSSISLNYGRRFKVCPVCGSKKIISDSNWKMLETKKKLMEKAADTLSTEANKNGIIFLCGIEWHC